MGYIYKIINDVNNKIYIGQTIRPIQKRQQQHLYYAKIYKDNDKDYQRRTKLYAAMNKYGIEHFSIEQVEECPDEKLNEREIYQISFYNSFREGYNLTLGGDGFSNYDIDTQEIYNLQDKGLGISEIANKMEVTRTVIRNRIYRYENYSPEEAIKRGMNNSNLAKNKLTYQQSTKGELINIFESQGEAGEFVGSNNKNMYDVIKNKRLFKNYYQTNTPTINLNEMKKNTRGNKKVGQYDLQDNLIAIFNSRKEAAESVGCDPSTISHCCTGKTKTVKGFKQKDID